MTMRKSKCTRRTFWNSRNTSKSSRRNLTNLAEETTMWKKIYKESGDDKNAVQIDTGLKGDLAADILNAVIGQMSDGLWENSPVMEHYWRFINVVKAGCNKVFLVADGVTADDEHVVNYFNYKMGMDERKIKEFIGKKVKEVAKEELKDTGDAIGWDRNNEHESQYLAGTFSDCYFVYETLIGRKGYERKYPVFMRDALLA